jgi:hypothetical protein
MTEGVFPKADGDVLFASEANGLVPIGTILPWVKSLTNTPSLTGQFVECNGQVLSDADSVYNGVTIPNLNGGTYKMLRGAATSGGTGGSDTHSHIWTSDGTTTNGNFVQGITGSINSTLTYDSAGNSQSVRTGIVDAQDTLKGPNYTSKITDIPAYYEVVYIIRVK